MYGKIFASMYSGSMVGSGPLAFACWAYVLANKDQDGLVELNPILIAAAIGQCTSDDVEKVISAFCEPDPKSRSQDEEGRKLLRRSSFMYAVVNHKVYDEIIKQEDRRSYMREYMKQYRQRNEPSGDKCAYCGDKADATDHIVPRVDGGADDDSNLVRCCASCNSSKNGLDVFVWLLNRSGPRKKASYDIAIQHPKIRLALDLHPDRESIIRSAQDALTNVNNSKRLLSISTSTEDKEGCGEKKGTRKIHRGNSAEAAERPTEVPVDVWMEFLAIRKAKRSPFTPKALAGVRREADRAGMSLTEALTTCIERGWQGFRSEWVADRSRRDMPEKSSDPDITWDEDGNPHIKIHPPSQELLDQMDRETTDEDRRQYIREHPEMFFPDGTPRHPEQWENFQGPKEMTIGQ